MKICWDSLAKLKYIGNGVWRTPDYDYYVEVDKCKWCGEPFMSLKHLTNPIFCSHTCCGTAKLTAYWGDHVPQAASLAKKQAKLMRDKYNVSDLPEVEISDPPKILKVKNAGRRGRPAGHRLSQATKNKMSAYRKGKKHSEKTRLKIMMTNRDKKKSMSLTDRSSHDGTWYIDRRGYKNIYVGNQSYIREHRWIAEQVLGRPLRSMEIVHHIDGNRLNNAHNNLVICNSWLHSYMHRKMKNWNNKGEQNI